MRHDSFLHVQRDMAHIRMEHGTHGSKMEREREREKAMEQEQRGDVTLSVKK